MIILLAFTSGIFVIDQNYRKSHEHLFDRNEMQGEYSDLITPRFGAEFLDALYV